MELTSQIANQIREVLVKRQMGISTNLKTQLSDVTLEEATAKVGSLNTIAALAFHINYYIAGVAQVLEGGLARYYEINTVLIYPPLDISGRLGKTIRQDF